MNLNLFHFDHQIIYFLSFYKYLDYMLLKQLIKKTMNTQWHQAKWTEQPGTN